MLRYYLLLVPKAASQDGDDLCIVGLGEQCSDELLS